MEKTREIHAIYNMILLEELLVLQIKRYAKNYRNSRNNITLCRSGVWIGVKVLGADSIILGTRKLWQMFPIKQKCHRTAAFLDNPNFSIWSSLEIFLPLWNRPGVQISFKKKAAVIFYFSQLNWKHSSQFSGT